MFLRKEKWKYKIDFYKDGEFEIELKGKTNSFFTKILAKAVFKEFSRKFKTKCEEKHVLNKLSNLEKDKKTKITFLEKLNERNLAYLIINKVVVHEFQKRNLRILFAKINDILFSKNFSEIFVKISGYYEREKN